MRSPRPEPVARALGTAVAMLLLASPGAAHQVEAELACPIPESEPVSLFVTGHTGPSCALSSGADMDSFNFFTFAGTLMRVVLASESDHLDPRLLVRDPTLALQSDSSCDGGTAALPLPRCAVVSEFVAPLDGIYTVEVSDAGTDEAGAYTLQLEALPGEVDELIDQPLFNDFDTLEIPTDIDHARVQAGVGQSIEVEMISCGDYMDPRIEAWGPDGQKLLDVHCETPAGPPPPLTGPVDCADDFEDPVNLCTANGSFDVEVEGIQRLALSDMGSNGRGRYDYTVIRAPEPSPTLLSLSALVATVTLASFRPKRLGAGRAGR